MRKAFGSLSNIDLGIMGLNYGSTSVTCYRFKFGNQTDAEDHAIYLIAHRGHMRWVKQTAITRPKEWKNWASNFFDLREACATDWIEYMKHREVDVNLPLKECKTCHEVCKLAVDCAMFVGIIEEVGQSSEGGMLQGRRGVRVEIDSRKLLAVSEESASPPPSSTRSESCASPTYMEGERAPSCCSPIIRETRLEDFKTFGDSKEQGSKEDWMWMGKPKGRTLSRKKDEAYSMSWTRIGWRRQ